MPLAIIKSYLFMNCDEYHKFYILLTAQETALLITYKALISKLQQNRL